MGKFLEGVSKRLGNRRPEIGGVCSASKVKGLGDDGARLRRRWSIDSVDTR